jgi:hypothetical protein
LKNKISRWAQAGNEWAEESEIKLNLVAVSQGQSPKYQELAEHIEQGM